MTIPQTYFLEWLDFLILTTLNPRKDFVYSLKSEELMIISDRILSETSSIQIQLNKHFFLLLKETEIRVQVKKYHSALIILLDHIVEYQKIDINKVKEFSELMNTLVCSLEELLSFIEIRYLKYLGLDERVPVTHFIILKKELKQKLEKIKLSLIKAVNNKNITEVVLVVLYAFLYTKDNSSVTYKQILYRKELINELEIFCETPKSSSTFSALDELLIYMNFNAIKYINYFKNSIIQKLDSLNSEVERLKKLLFLSKEFNQIYSNENISFNPKNENLKTVISDWFVQEIAYLEKNIGQPIFTLKDSEKILDSSRDNNKENKITCLLSADQIGLILRASDESRILNAKSMSTVFKMIVPHLSTTHKIDLSYHSVRSKSYNAEDKDKEIAIEALEKIIKKIRTY